MSLKMIKKFLDLGRQPITNAYLTENDLSDEFLFHLSVGFDEETKLVSLMEFVKPQMMFNDTYAHRASMSATMRESFTEIALSIKQQFKPAKVLEIGSNDGVFIKNFNKDEIVALEPCGNLAEMTKQMGYETYPYFWNTEIAKKIIKNHGKMDIVYSANTLCHIEDLKGVFEALNIVLNDSGVLIFEDPSLYDLLRNTSYDQFYDEHAHLFSVIALKDILSKSNFEIFKVENLATHGGSNRIYAKKTSTHSIKIDKSVEQNIQKELDFEMDKMTAYDNFAQRVKTSKDDLISLLTGLKRQGKKIISYGATYKSTTIFNYCRIGTDLIDYITDTTPNKQGKLSPGSHIPIISPEEGFNDSVDYAFLGAWNFYKEIMNKETEFINRGGKFITHVPHVKVL
jgi:methylation protein EvaC